MPATRWQSIVAELRAEISDGRLAPGQRLPNEAELARRFAVNRHTLRQAVQALAREGFVEVRHGAGTFVRALVLDYALERRTRLTQNLAQAGERAERELLAEEVCNGPPWSTALGLGAGGRTELLYTRATVRGRAVALGTSAFALPRLAGIGAAFARLGSVTTALAELGVADYTRSRSAVSARLPSRAEADALARSPMQPVLVVHYTNVDTAGAPVEAGCTLFAADAVQLIVAADGWGEP